MEQLSLFEQEFICPEYLYCKFARGNACAHSKSHPKLRSCTDKCVIGIASDPCIKIEDLSGFSKRALKKGEYFHESQKLRI